MITSKKYFNPEGCDILDEKIWIPEHASDSIKPTGFIDFNRPKYDWSKKIYNTMMANTWFPEEVNTSTEKKNFELLSENEQNIYRYTFAQLSFNDSIQTDYLTDFLSKANNRIVKACLTVQAMQEVNHDNSYAVLLDASGRSDEVFDLYRTDDVLSRKNERIANQFARYINGTGSDEMLMSAAASVALEGIYFLTGFGFIYTIGDKVPGARDMIQFIARDEFTHLPMFANIFKTIRSENSVSSGTIDTVYGMIEEAVDIELEYALYLERSFPILGMSEDIIKKTVWNYANDRLLKIGLEPIFDQSEKTYMQKLVDKHKNLNDSRTNMFEGNVKNYSKASINMDDF